MRLAARPPAREPDEAATTADAARHGRAAPHEDAAVPAQRPPAAGPRAGRRPRRRVPVPERGGGPRRGRGGRRAGRPPGRLRGPRLRQGAARAAGRAAPGSARSRSTTTAAAGRPADQARLGRLRHARAPVPAGRPDAGVPPRRSCSTGPARPVPWCWRTTTTASSATTSRRCRRCAAWRPARTGWSTSGPLEDPGPRAAAGMGGAAGGLPRPGQRRSRPATAAWSAASPRRR